MKTEPWNISSSCINSPRILYPTGLNAYFYHSWHKGGKLAQLISGQIHVHALITLGFRLIVLTLWIREVKIYHWTPHSSCYSRQHTIGWYSAKVKSFVFMDQDICLSLYCICAHSLLHSAIERASSCIHYHKTSNNITFNFFVRLSI